MEVMEATSHLQKNGQIVSRILGQLRTRVRARNLSPRTEKKYLGWIERYLGFHGRRDPARRAVHHTTIQRAIKTAVREAGITKPLSAHVLRACFATEMVRSGCELTILQRLMAHEDLKTTARYLHVAQRPGLNIESPLDRLPSQRG